MARHFSTKAMLAHHDDVRTQYAALCFRIRKEKPQFLLITSRGTGRWIIPKGWPMRGKSPAKAALREAWEEAGVRGRVDKDAIGVFSYRKVLGRKRQEPCIAIVFPVAVKSLDGSFPEAKQRRRKWFGRKKAAARVSEPELAEIIRNFDPRLLRR
ncbi:NUDIX hydrolase [Lutimaribacter saemankumensis]|uniref:8-oxo-dGTP pyrophosphatase MutT, NUDIX family n=1 Tax=Lutimaribacter saemankumensis TaxID=490829 RepID=A0A1G8MKB3_9RHOB|nr:8-oxo-dGTP pyrophosphatase MutT, NUDIX family [Lutimaribacter saemankumensis]